DRGRIERANLARVGTQRPSHLDGSRPSFFQRRVVEIGIGIRVEDFMRQRRWLCRIDRDCPDFTSGYAFEDMLQSIEIHRFVQAVSNRLLDEGMIWYANFARQVVAASGLVRKYSGEQIV